MHASRASLTRSAAIHFHRLSARHAAALNSTGESSQSTPSFRSYSRCRRRTSCRSRSQSDPEPLRCASASVAQLRTSRLALASPLPLPASVLPRSQRCLHRSTPRALHRFLQTHVCHATGAAAMGESALPSGDVFFLDEFAVRQWDSPDCSGTRIAHDKADFVKRWVAGCKLMSGILDAPLRPSCQ